MEQVCPLCASTQLKPYLRLPYCMASDASQVNETVTVNLCKHCSGVFKVYPSLEKAKQVITKINERSTLHAAGGMVETRVAYHKHPQGITKSAYIYQFIAEHVQLKSHGSLLDIGCHFGAFLSAFAEENPDWSLAGFDVSERFRATVENITDNVRFFSDSLPTLDHKYDLIAISHVLEHVLEIDALFDFIQQNLADDGMFFLQCNNIEENPFLPLVYEQYYNFSLVSLTQLCQKHGLHIKSVTKNWINKELSLLITKASSNASEQHRLSSNINIPNTDINITISQLERNQQFFLQMCSSLAELAEQKVPVSLFGTTYPAKWVSYFNQLTVKYFVDENPLLIGTTIDGLKVISPKDVPKDMPILLVFPQEVAQSIKARLQSEIAAELLLAPFHINSTTFK